MRSNNPVFNRTEAFSRGGYATFRDAPPPSAEQLETMYAAPSATPLRTGRMSYDDVVTKTGLTFGLLFIGAGVGWFIPALMWVGLIGGLVLGLVNAFKREPSPPLILAYAALEGLFVGGLSWLFSARWGGIVPQAVLATLAVAGAALFAYKSGRIRVTPRFTRGLLIAGGGYLVFCLVNLGLVAFTDVNLRFDNPVLGLVIGAFAVGLAAMFLILDFDFVDQGVRNGLPDKYSWTAAFGLTVTMVWLYIEMLRLLAILRGDE